MLGHTRRSSNRERRGVANGGACVPKVLTAAELEGFVAGVISPEQLEPADGAAVGEDMEEPQEFAVDPSRGAHHTRQEGVGDTPPRGVDLPVPSTCVRVVASSLAGWAFWGGG